MIAATFLLSGVGSSRTVFGSTSSILSPALPRPPNLHEPARLDDGGLIARRAVSAARAALAQARERRLVDRLSVHRDAERVAGPHRPPHRERHRLRRRGPVTVSVALSPSGKPVSIFSATPAAVQSAVDGAKRLTHTLSADS